MSGTETTSGAQRQYRKGKGSQASRDAALREAKGKRTLTETEQLEFRVRDLEEKVLAREATIERQQVQFDEMLRRSEAVRNRQVDIINRLKRGGTWDDEFVILQGDLAAAHVHLERYEAAVADLEAKLAEERQKIQQMQVVIDNLTGKKKENSDQPAQH